MPELAQKCKNNAIFKQSYTLKQFVAFIMAYLVFANVKVGNLGKEWKTNPV